MKPGPIARTNRELDEQLDRTALDLLTAARILQSRYAEFSAPDAPELATPIWSDFAAQAFEACEIIGVDAAIFASARELRPWVGEWTASGGYSLNGKTVPVGAR